MTDETQKTASEAPQATAPVNENVEKVQEVGKKLTGFLGGLAEKAKNLDMKELAEKAKNLDVKELAEKAKNIDVKELSEKAKQKVNDVKDKVNETTLGKSEAVTPPRESISASEFAEIFKTASTALIEEIPPLAKTILADVSVGEKLSVCLNLPDSAVIAVSDKTVYQLVKVSDQFCAYAYPLSSIVSFSILPPRGENLGLLTISTKTNEVKVKLSDISCYAKFLIVYKRMKDAIG